MENNKKTNNGKIRRKISSVNRFERNAENKARHRRDLLLYSFQKQAGEPFIG